MGLNLLNRLCRRLKVAKLGRLCTLHSFGPAYRGSKLGRVLRDCMHCGWIERVR